MPVSIEITGDDLGRFISRIEDLADLDTAELMEGLGALGESQTRRRIEDEKTGPDGEPWASNESDTSILLRTGKNLRDSLTFNASADQAEWGATWEFAHIHQNGAIIVPKNGKALVFNLNGATVFAGEVYIPSRPFVGISDDNAEEIREFVSDWIEGQL